MNHPKISTKSNHTVVRFPLWLYHAHLMLDQPPMSLSANGLTITVLVSQYHAEITNRLVDGAKQAFLAAGGSEDLLKIIPVAGAWELPVVAASLTKQDDLDAIVTLGCIITGETTHDRVIADAIAHGLMQIATTWVKPISIGIITCQTIEQANARSGGTCGNKGVEAMNAAISTHNVIFK